jgi:NTP pyrophosphatase (non-canonical NTP hydrolase)
MKNVMLDLETMGSGSNAAIIAIGAVEFNPVKGLGDEFYVVVNLASSVSMGGKIDPDTVMWWMKQESESRAAVCRDGLALYTALTMFSEWLVTRNVDIGEVAIWGNGAAFDNVVLANAYKNTAMKPPWNYRNDRCYRTVAAMNSHIPMKKEGPVHNALQDAKNQARHLIEIFMKNISDPAPLTMTINDLMVESHATAVEKGWWESSGRNFGELVALANSELSEAFEEYRKGKGLDQIYYANGKPEGIPIEFADLFIRIADTCHHYGIPLEQALRIKMDFNRTRPHRHGGKKA